mmetsp:Transcript_9765/g.18871  ORF Transcript_9765/g.18871 Transcript_9765/m.18871 type:complete len:445 (+) Transcript_9765:49-1383(+)
MVKHPWAPSLQDENQAHLRQISSSTSSTFWDDDHLFESQMSELSFVGFNDDITSFKVEATENELQKTLFDYVTPATGISLWQNAIHGMRSALTQGVTFGTNAAYTVGNILLGGNSSESGFTAPKQMHDCFNLTGVVRWDPAQFVLIRKLQDAPRNLGQVLLMQDIESGHLVAVKKVPTAFCGTSHTDFMTKHAAETEQPWQDVGCLAFLNKVGYEHACKLHGVFRDETFTYMATSFATEGDLQTWCTQHQPYLAINVEECLCPLILRLFESLAQLHDLSIVHGDLSLENALLTSEGVEGERQLKLIDFGMSSSQRFRKASNVRGKAIYMAPELCMAGKYDGFLADTFAVGVMVFTLTVGDYPWTSTKPFACERFEYFRRYGFDALLELICESNNITTGAALSKDFKQLLKGLLAVNPSERLTLGEEAYQCCSRQSVWDEPWVRA